MLIHADSEVFDCPICDYLRISAFFCWDYREILDMLANANEIEFEVYINEDVITLKPEITELSDFKEVARNLYKSNVIYYIDGREARLFISSGYIISY